LHPEIQTQDVRVHWISTFMLSKWKKDYREGKLNPAAEAAGLSLPKVLRAPKRDPEKQALRRQVKQLEARLRPHAVRALERKLAALEVGARSLKKKPSASISNAKAKFEFIAEHRPPVPGGFLCERYKFPGAGSTHGTPVKRSRRSREMSTARPDRAHPPR